MDTNIFFEINKKLQWQDFHDAGLLSLSFQFSDKIDFSYSSNIIMEIVTSLKEAPERPVIIKCLFTQVKNIEIDAMMDDCNLSDSSTIYSLSENDGIVKLVSVKGWKLKFITSETEIIIEDADMSGIGLIKTRQTQ